MQLKLIDFGGAESDNVEHLTQITGTRAYMAPECAQGKEYNGYCADVFSLGVLLFRMALGYLPYRSADSFDYNFSLLASKSYE